MTDPATVETTPTVRAPADPVLAEIRTVARLLDDLEIVRIMQGNRIGALEREYGEPLPHLLPIQEALVGVEALAVKELVRAWRKHPLAPWAADIKGCGEKLIARLVAEIGDPAERPNVAKLWAYCGHGDPARSRIPKGATQTEIFKRGRPQAKKATWKLAYQFMRTSESPYRDVYLAARERYAERVHEAACPQCKAKSGDPWTDGHKHAAALRYVGKVFLRDLWIEARRLHEPVGPQAPHEAA